MGIEETKSVTDHTRVAPTAWGVSYLRTFTDIPLAKEFYDALNRHLQASGETNISTRGKRDYLAPQLEARYKLVEKLITEQNPRQVFELASGVATHGINLTRSNPNITYVEMDLPGVVQEKKAILEEIGARIPTNLMILEGDALSENDVRNATKHFSPDKPLTIVNEGLMRYLTFDEKTRLARIIQEQLQRFGGVWITPDISLQQALSRENNASKGHIQNLKTTTGIDIDKNVFRDKHHAREFFEQLGFNIEEHSFLEVADQLVSPQKLGMNDEEVTLLNEHCFAFVMSLKTR